MQKQTLTNERIAERRKETRETLWTYLGKTVHKQKYKITVCGIKGLLIADLLFICRHNK